MLGAARLLGTPMVVAVVALAVPHATPAHAPAKPARTWAPHVRPAWHRPTIVGEWQFGNGFFVFYRTRAKTFSDKVVLQRPSAFCPEVNDQDGQIVLHHKPRSRVYTGTWQWFYTSNCKFAGYGPLTIKVWRAGDIATFVSAPPPGLTGTTNIFTLYRVERPTAAAWPRRARSTQRSPRSASLRSLP